MSDDMKATRRGWVTGLSQSEYRADPAWGSSDLKPVLDCPAEAHWRRVAPASEPSAAMRIGTLTHLAILERPRFDATVRVSPKFDRRTKDGKEGAAAFAASLPPGAEVVTDDELEQIENMAAAGVRALTEIGIDLGDGCAELSGFLPLIQGVPLKVRPDWIGPDTIVDVKTCQDASPDAFARAVANYRYHLSAAMYCEVASALGGNYGWHNWYWLAIQSSAPWHAVCYRISREALAKGSDAFRDAIETVARCEREHRWPGYAHGTEIDLPRWAV